jgi:hypothetical protein
MGSQRPFIVDTIPNFAGSLFDRINTSGRRIMKRWFAFMIMCALGSSISLTAQTDSLVDVFPLAVGNQWVYRYFTLTEVWPAGDPVETRTDSGRVTYDVSGTVNSPDSTRWQFHVTRDLTRHQILYFGIPRDTTYPIRDSSSFELIERHQGQHQLYRNEDAGAIHLDVFPFTRNFTDTTLVYRYRRVGVGDTVAFRSTYYPNARSVFTFRQDIGLVRFRYNSGTMDVYDTAHHYLLNSIITSTEGGSTAFRPDGFRLFQNYPNPFNPVTTLHFTIDNRQLTVLKVYDLLGREVTALVNEVKQPGAYTVQWDASAAPSGMYFCRLQAGGLVDVKKLILLR